MTENNNIPDNDRDKLLAWQYDWFLRGNIRSSEITDPFLHILLKIRNEEERVQAVIPVRGRAESTARLLDCWGNNYC